MKYILSDKTSRFHLIILFALTLLLATIGSMLNIPGVMEHPQFGQPLDPDFVLKVLNEKFVYSFSYYGTFVVDFAWAASLLLAIRKFVKRRIGDSKLNILFSVIFVLSYVSDAAENFTYMFAHCYVKWLVYTKIGLYAVSMVIYLYYFLKHYWDQYSSIIFTFLKSSALSLIIIFLLGSLLPKATQINSIVVDLYNYPLNFLVLIIVAPFYASFLAHYPSYFSPTNNKRWNMKNSWWFFGIISYEEKQRPIYKIDLLNFLYRTLGIIFYAALFYFLGYTSEVNFGWTIGIGKLSFVLLAFGVYLLYSFKLKKDNWLKICYGYLKYNLPKFRDTDTPYIVSAENDAKPNEYSHIVKPVNEGFIWFTITFLVNIGLLIYLILANNESRYTELTAVWGLIAIALQTISYVYFRTFRSTYKMVLYHSDFPQMIKPFLDSKSEKTTVEQIQMVNRFFDQNKFERGRFLEFFSKLGIGRIGSDSSFLNLMTYGSIVNAIFLIVINVFNDLSFKFNTSVIIFSYLLLFYGVFTVIGKHLIYYNSLGRVKKNLQFRTFLYGSVVLLITFKVLSDKAGNRLFTLNTIPEEETVMSLEEFSNNLEVGETRYFIGSYGGGMKANAWTMVVLNELKNREPKFFDQVVAMSGASGGTIGIMNMSAILRNKPDSVARRRFVDTVSTTNMLAMDITHTLGRDALGFMFVPDWICDLSGKDRSTKAMATYAKLTSNHVQNCAPSTFRGYWNELYNEYGHFPILIANTTNVRGNQGMAVSVRADNSGVKKLLYNGADDILDFTSECDTLTQTQTLSFYNAFSTSNRFPVISPAAKIERKGQYNDGGIYENSGLLSAFKTYQAIEYLQKKSDSVSETNVFINIVNDKNLYIKYCLSGYLSCLDSVNESSEIGAIINAVAATEMMPLYIKNKIQILSDTIMFPETSTRFETIYLPHRFTVSDIENAFGGELDVKAKETTTKEILYNLVKENDKIVHDLVGKDYIIEPPMSRVLAPQAVDFMHKMLKDNETSYTIDKILNY